MKKKLTYEDLKLSMLSDLIEEVDYDLWKSMFVEDCMEDPEAAMEHRAGLLKLIDKHLDLIVDNRLEHLPRSCEG
jgi:hypothetical protein